MPIEEKGFFGVGKIIRCPVHDLISVDSTFALRVINSGPMQRLRRIRQLGLASLVYPGADHSRFNHSLGAYHLATVVMNKLNDRHKHAGKESPFNEIEYAAVSLGALVHDLGHGPFSHMFESVGEYALGPKKVKHEQWTKEIFQSDPQIQKAMQKASEYYKEDIGKLIVEIFDGLIPPDKYYLKHLLSSQLDVDRFDYLLRDSLMTGANYGEHLDFAWILRNLDVGKVQYQSPDDDEPTPQEVKVLYIDGTHGLSSVESYLLGCFFMYRHVYYHKVINAAESMLQTILKRMVDLIRGGKMDAPHPVFDAFARGEKPTVEEYLSLNDYFIWTWLEDWAAGHTDEILHQLSEQLLSRKVFGGFIQPESTQENEEKCKKIKEIISAQGLDPRYFLIEDSPTRLAYTSSLTSRKKGKTPEPIWIKLNNTGIVELDGVKSFVIQAEEVLKMNEKRWYVPKKLVLDIRNETGLTKL